MIQLHIGSFVIGRSEEIAQYVEMAVGVSRAHLEMMVTRNGCTIKDLGSRNGTKLIGEEIAPYKEYSLSTGDTFTIAEQAYTLRISNNNIQKMM
ncbi:FHA domain-containing protein FhaA [compost metagenome]